MPSNPAASVDYLPSEQRESRLSSLNRLPDSIVKALNSITLPTLVECLPAVLHFSAFFKRICERYPHRIVELIESSDIQNAYSDTELINKIHKSYSELDDVLLFDSFIRQHRHIEMARIVWRELSGCSQTQQTIRELSDLADAILQITVSVHFDRLSQKHGEPKEDITGQPARFVVFGLGKLGGRELNFSSDIDLVFVYTADGLTMGDKPISNSEFFIKLGRAVIHSLNEINDEGQVYRVDMRLRPNGQSGPLAMSFSAMENYYQIHGREWERYAWIKARAVAGHIESGQAFLAQLRPFVYRKYLDYQVYESLEEMKSMINKEIRQKGMRHNIKLGRGGIREIEFIVQSHQLVRGGRDPLLRTGSLKSALDALEKSQQIDQAVAHSLYQAYLFLRTVEHRLQMKDDQQTHQLPQGDEGWAFLAASMGFERTDFTEMLDKHRDFVQQEFTRLYNQQRDQQPDDAWQVLWSQVVNNQLPGIEKSRRHDFSDTLAAYVQSKAYRSLEARGRIILDQLIPKILDITAEQPNPQQALNRSLEVISSIAGRVAYLSLLDQFPIACRQLIQLCGASAWVSKWIAEHPIVLDTLINPRTDLYSFNEDIEQLIENRLANEADDELKHDILRQIHHSCILQIAMSDLQSQYTAVEVRGYVSKVAESIINQVVKLCQTELIPRFGQPVSQGDHDAFGVIAYGKLGSGELSYNADLDLVFVFDDENLTGDTQGGRKSVRADYYYSRLVQRILTMLTMQTSAGKLYDVDTRLRPSGRSGLLVSSLKQYKKYQQEKAWVWEHQALVKARLITYNPVLESVFNKIRCEVLCQQRDVRQLKEDIVSMRQRMREAGQTNKTNYKINPGGMIDIEFISQFLVLRFAHEYPEICNHRSVTNILKFARQHVLVDQHTIDTLKSTYLLIQEIENQHKLNGVIEQTRQKRLKKKMEQVKHVWQSLLS